MLVKPALLHFKFDGFANLPTTVNSCVWSDHQTDCNGNEWKLELYPGGRSHETEQGWVGLYLRSYNRASLDTACSMTIKDASGTVIVNCDGCFMFQLRRAFRGYSRFIKRSEILDTNKNILKDGALCIDVTIQVKPILKEDLYECKFSLINKMERLLQSGENSDSIFNVGGEIFKVHSCIIDNSASPILANQLNRNDQNTNIEIQGISPEVFRYILRFVYTDICLCHSEVLKFGKELIDAANRYELVELKIDIENVLICERIMNRENVSDWILFADAQCCTLLKEYAISYFLLDSSDILRSEHSKRLRESGEVLSEIMMLMADGDEGMTVTELRKQLGKIDLDVDGSKETLAARLARYCQEAED